MKNYSVRGSWILIIGSLLLFTPPLLWVTLDQYQVYRAVKTHAAAMSTFKGRVEKTALYRWRVGGFRGGSVRVGVLWYVVAHDGARERFIVDEFSEKVKAGQSLHHRWRGDRVEISYRPERRIEADKLVKGASEADRKGDTPYLADVVCKKAGAKTVCDPTYADMVADERAGLLKILGFLVIFLGASVLCIRQLVRDSKRSA